jgi:hypothetical protein
MYASKTVGGSDDKRKRQREGGKRRKEFDGICVLLPYSKSLTNAPCQATRSGGGQIDRVRASGDGLDMSARACQNKLWLLPITTIRTIP